MYVFHQIFVAEEYSVLRELKNVSLVLDLGANVGYSSAYFLTCFPTARVVAVEPDERNVAVCRINLTPFGSRALILHGAAWPESTRLCLSKADDGMEWATRVSAPIEGGAGEVQAWDMNSLIAIAGGTTIDLLKIDIEGAELVLFGDTAKQWLPQVRNICIELHGADCEEAFFNALADFEYELEYSGELTICRDLRLKTAQLHSTMNAFGGRSGASRASEVI
jgi:FkbM family methyltransferase